MNIFLTGAGGYIGGSVAPALLANGHKVRGLARSESGAQALRSRGLDAVVGTLDDEELLAREARAADGVINTASSDHAGAVRALIRGLEGSGKPLLHTSGSSVVADDARGAHRSERVFDDESPLVVHPMKQARRDIDTTVLAAAEQGVRTAVICPTLIYGIGRGPKTDSVQIPLMAANASEQGVVQIVGAGLNVWSTVHLDDVVELYRLALDRAAAGALYFAENGEASFGAIGAAIARRLGLPGVESLAPEVAAARWGDARAYFSLGSNSRVRAVRARRELGWIPRHASVLDWIANELPIPTNPAFPS